MNKGLRKAGEWMDGDHAWQCECGTGPGVCRLIWQGRVMELGGKSRAECKHPVGLFPCLQGGETSKWEKTVVFLSHFLG